MNNLSDFSSFILSLASSAFYYMGESPDQEIKGEINLDIAKHTIDTISMLEKKTDGNLQPDEIKLIEDILYKLRTKFIKLKKLKNQKQRNNG